MQDVIMVMHTPAGRTAWISMSAAPIRASDGTLLGAVAIAADITALHELQEQREDLVRLESAQLRLARQPTELRAFIAHLLQRSAEVMEVGRVRVEIPAELPPVDVDPNRLEGILTNLLSNALRYSHPETEVLVRAKKVDGTVVVSVTDQGLGIPPEDQVHLFERFYRAKGVRKTEGLGLGLYILSCRYPWAEAARAQRGWLGPLAPSPAWRTLWGAPSASPSPWRSSRQFREDAPPLCPR